MSYGEIGRGLADIVVYVLSGVDDEPGTGIDGPGARSLTWQAEQDTEPWEGDDTTLATTADPKNGTGSLALGRSNGTFLAAILGGSAVASGTTPNQKIIHEETAEGGGIYVRIAGQAKSADLSGSAYQVDLHKGMVFSPSETLALKAYNEPTSDITFVPNVDGKFVTRTWFETGVTIPTDLTP